MFYGALRRHAFCAKYLIEQGADPFKQDKSYRMALHHAAANGAVAVLKMMLSDSLKIQAPSGLVSLKDARKLNLVTNCRYAHILCALRDSTLGLTAIHMSVA